ncbi:MAG: type II secretion system protein [Pseudomonadota bacterium]
MNTLPRGFTLVEILVALVITATGLSGSLAMFVWTQQQHTSGLHAWQASHLLFSATENLRAAGTPNAALWPLLIEDTAQQLPAGRLEATPVASDTWRVAVQWRDSRFPVPRTQARVVRLR